jgi:hypothetical protein
MPTSTPASMTSATPLSTNFGLQHDAWGRLVLIDADGRRFVGVEPIRVFPISSPQHWISICDAEGREIACVEDLAKLPERARQVLEEDLARREFIPQIKRIVKVSGGSEPSEWEVETDRGTTTFMLKSDDDVRRLGAHSVLIMDSYGIRYLIADSRQLDAHSRRLLERYL